MITSLVFKKTANFFFAGDLHITLPMGANVRITILDDFRRKIGFPDENQCYM
jgi:hypothetical protein